MAADHEPGRASLCRERVVGFPQETPATDISFFEFARARRSFLDADEPNSAGLAGLLVLRLGVRTALSHSGWVTQNPPSGLAVASAGQLSLGRWRGLGRPDLLAQRQESRSGSQIAATAEIEEVGGICFLAPVSEMR